MFVHWIYILSSLHWKKSLQPWLVGIISKKKSIMKVIKWESVQQNMTNILGRENIFQIGTIKYCAVHLFSHRSKQKTHHKLVEISTQWRSGVTHVTFVEVTKMSSESHCKQWHIIEESHSICYHSGINEEDAIPVRYGIVNIPWKLYSDRKNYLALGPAHLHFHRVVSFRIDDGMGFSTLETKQLLLIPWCFSCLYCSRELSWTKILKQEMCDLANWWTTAWLILVKLYELHYIYVTVNTLSMLFSNLSGFQN